VSGWRRFADSFGATRKEYFELSSADDDNYVQVYDDAYNILKGLRVRVTRLNWKICPRC
jgi:hypothetical protein